MAKPESSFHPSPKSLEGHLEAKSPQQNQRILHGEFARTVKLPRKLFGEEDVLHQVHVLPAILMLNRSNISCFSVHGPWRFGLVAIFSSLQWFLWKSKLCHKMDVLTIFIIQTNISCFSKRIVIWLSRLMEVMAKFRWWCETGKESGLMALQGELHKSFLSAFRNWFLLGMWLLSGSRYSGTCLFGRSEVQLGSSDDKQSSSLYSCLSKVWEVTHQLGLQSPSFSLSIFICDSLFVKKKVFF